MRFIETKKLAEFIDEWREVAECGSVSRIYNAVRVRDIPSLQEASLLGDSDYLREVASVLRIISSIIHHPHLTNRSEEVISRIEQVGHLENEEFREVLRDSKLWKKHGVEMIPEEVHYHQHIDEIKIYENRFIVLLIDLLGKEMEKYNSFYLSKLPTVSLHDKRLKSGKIGEILILIDNISRRIRFIKNTYFYKEISKEKSLYGRIRPTNILTKDRLYRRCYKFYLKFMTHDDITRIKLDMRTYYVFHILKGLSTMHFNIESETEDRIRLANKSGLAVEIGLPDYDTVSLDVDYLGRQKVSHLLRVTTGEGGENALGTHATEDAISLWKLMALDGRESLHSAPEEKLISTWLSSKLKLAALDRLTYEKYCPVCTRRAVTKSGELCICRECKSEYMFIPELKNDTAWFRILRK